jgi:type IV secretory pathway VirB10-like protein
MSSQDDLQTIPARHGTATFVPKGSTIKIVNTSGTQVIDTWAFALPTPPKNKGPQEQPEDDKDKSYQEQDEKEKLNVAEEEDKKKREEAKKKEQEEKEKASKKKANRKSKGGLDLPSQEEAEAATSQQQIADAEAKQQSTPTKSSWSSYLPSLRGRKQIADGSAKEDGKTSDKKEEAASTEETDEKQDKENSRKWGSYLLKGQGVTSYLPSKGAISAFAAQVSVCFIATSPIVVLFDWLLIGIVG